METKHSFLSVFGLIGKITRIRNSRRIIIRKNINGELIIRAPFSLSVKNIIKLIEKKKEQIQKILPVQKIKKDRAEFLRHKAMANRLIKKKLLEFNSVYGFSYTKISIKDQLSRWGSCSKSGRLSFNYRLVFLPDELIDYIVVHELCHLKEMNHSRAFWQLVAKTIPDWQAKRLELRKLARGVFTKNTRDAKMD